MQNHQVEVPLRSTPLLSLISPARELRKSRSEKIAKKPESAPNKDYSGIKTLAEAVILQAMEDLWSKTHRQKSIEFFRGDGFKHYADLAGMSAADRTKLLKMVGK